MAAIKPRPVKKPVIASVSGNMGNCIPLQQVIMGLPPETRNIGFDGRRTIARGYYSASSNASRFFSMSVAAMSNPRASVISLAANGSWLLGSSLSQLVLIWFRTEVSNIAESGMSFALGFHNGHAAQISRIKWGGDDTERAEQFAGATVYISMDGAAGPWELLAEWEFDRARGSARRNC